MAQQKATEEAVRSVEAKFTNDVWDRQRRWEMKRDAVLSIVQAAAQACDALILFASPNATEAQNKPVSTAFHEKTRKHSEAFFLKLEALEVQRHHALLLCGVDFAIAVADLSLSLRDQRSLLNDEPESLLTLLDPVHEKLQAVLRLARTELGIPDDPSFYKPTAPHSAP